VDWRHCAWGGPGSGDADRGAVTDYDTLRVTSDEDRVVVELHRPAQRNAINADGRRAARGVRRAGTPATIADHHRAGTDFAAGADIGEAYACDIRIASSTARFGNPEAGLGILAAAGASYRLADLVGKSVAKQVILAGRLLNADVALRHGLVWEVVEPGSALRAACTLAERVGRSAPLALRLSKAVLDAQCPHPLLDDIAQAVLFESPDKNDRMSRFLEKSRS